MLHSSVHLLMYGQDDRDRAPVELLCPIFGDWHWLACHAAQCQTLLRFVARCGGDLYYLTRSWVERGRLSCLFVLVS